MPSPADDAPGHSPVQGPRTFRSIAHNLVFYRFAVMSIADLRRTWTDLRVVVDSPLPEHARFLGRVAVVKTVNQGGRALIQFVDSVDTAWYDIDPARLQPAPATPVAPLVSDAGDSPA